MVMATEAYEIKKIKTGHPVGTHAFEMGTNLEISTQLKQIPI